MKKIEAQGKLHCIKPFTLCNEIIAAISIAAIIPLQQRVARPIRLCNSIAAVELLQLIAQSDRTLTMTINSARKRKQKI